METVKIDEILERYEARKAEGAKVESVKAEPVAAIDYDKLASAVADKMLEGKKVEGAKAEIPAGEETPAEFTTAMHFKAKLGKADQMIYDAVRSKNIPGDGFKLEFPLDVAEGEDRLRWAYKHEKRQGSKADIDGAASYGAEVVPALWGTDLYMRMADMDGDLQRFFPKVGMTSNVQYISELLGDITVSAYSSYQDQNLAIGAVSATASTTTKATLTASTFVAKENVYDFVSADAIVNLIRGLRQKMAMKIGSKLSAAILNGDTTSTHMDEDLEAAGANIPEAMWKGLRKLTMAGSLGVDGTDAAYTIANLISVRALMKKYAIGANKSACKWIFGVESYNKLVGLLQAQTASPQMANYTMANGDVELLFGHEIITSEHQREDLEIDGYADSTGTDGNQGFITLVNTNQFVLGVRDNLTINIIPDPLNARRQIQGTLRMDFQPFETPSTTISCVAGLYSFTV